MTQPITPPLILEPVDFATHIRQVEAAKRERDAVLAANKAKSLDGRHRKPSAAFETLVNTPRVSPMTRAVLRRETVMAAACRDKHPEQWRKDIAKITPLAVRVRVACVVWWDHFGGRPVSATERWGQLDEWLEMKVSVVADYELAAALAQVGYSPAAAKQRAEGEEIEGAETRGGQE